MKTKGFLIVSRSGSLKAVKSLRAAIDPDSVAIAIDLQIPDSAFKPFINASIVIPEKDVTPVLINSGKLQKMSSDISNEIGLNVVLSSFTYDGKKA